MGWRLEFPWAWVLKGIGCLAVCGAGLFCAILMLSARPPHNGREFGPVYGVLSPDGKIIACIRRNALVHDPAFIPGTDTGIRTYFTDSADLTWASSQTPMRARSVHLDDADMRKEWSHGSPRALGARISFAPDSAHIAALCARFLTIVDLSTGASNRLRFQDEVFEAARWLSSGEIAFATYKGGQARFWRLRLAPRRSARSLIYECPNDSVFGYYDPTRRPPQLGSDKAWSPDGRFAILQHRFNQSDVVDLFSWHAVPLPIASPTSRWSPDSSSVLLSGLGLGAQDREERWLLVKPRTGGCKDVTAEIVGPIMPGESGGYAAEFEGWTPDSRNVVFTRPGDNPASWLLQADPFKVLLRRTDILASSPIAGWVFQQERGGLGSDLAAPLSRRSGGPVSWLSYDGSRHCPLNGWPSDPAWTWSRDAEQAAYVEDGKTIIIRPSLPK
jgi:hypothetical protein